MLAGSLDRRLRLERATETQSPIDGSVTLTWIAVYDVWGLVEPLQGRELFEAQQWVAKADTRFTIRWQPPETILTPDETARIVYDGRNYDIKHVAEVGRREALQILAQARAE